MNPDPDPSAESEPAESEPAESESLADTDGELQSFLGSEQPTGRGWHLLDPDQGDQGGWREIDADHDKERLDLSEEGDNS